MVRPNRTRSERQTYLTFPWRIFKDDPSLTSEDNPRTQALAARLGGEICKRCRAYRLSI